MSIPMNWILLGLVLCQIHSTYSFDIVELLENWLFKNSPIKTPRKILLNNEAQQELIKQMQMVNTNIQTLQQKCKTITAEIEDWRHYLSQSNFIFRFLLGLFVRPRLERKERRIREELENAQYKKSYEPFCDNTHYSHSLNYDDICENIMKEKFFSDKNWKFIPKKYSSLCKKIDVQKIEENPKTREPDFLVISRHVRRCLAIDESGKVPFYVYLAAGLSYHTSMTARFPFFVFLEKDIISNYAFNSGYTFHDPYTNHDIRVAAYIE